MDVIANPQLIHHPRLQSRRSNVSDVLWWAGQRLRNWPIIMRRVFSVVSERPRHCVPLGQPRLVLLASYAADRISDAFLENLGAAVRPEPPLGLCLFVRSALPIKVACPG